MISNGTRWLEDFSPGEVFTGGPREMTERDLLYCALWCGDGQPHSNEEYSRRTPWGRRMLHGDGLLAMGFGLIHRQGIFSGSHAGTEAMAIRYRKPVFIGDRISARLTIDAVAAQPEAPAGRVAATLQITNDAIDAVAIEVQVDYAVRRKS